MLRVMRDESQPMPLRADMAKAAAPYFHPRLNAIEQTGNNGGPLIVILDEDQFQTRRFRSPLGRDCRRRCAAQTSCS